ncbi:MAG: DNA translocase FtsK [Candidatus Eremiobacterota bacterium]
MVQAKLKTIEKPKKRSVRKSKSDKKKKVQVKTWHMPSEIITLCTGSFSIFILFILLFSNRSDLVGALGMTLGNGLKNLLGLASFFLVPLLTGLSILIWKKALSFKYIGSGVVFFLTITLLMELCSDTGGNLGHVSLTFISTYLGIYGAGLFLATIAVISFIIMTGMKFANVLSIFRMIYISCMLISRKIISLFDWIFYMEDDEYEEEEIEEEPPVELKKKENKKFTTSFQEALIDEKPAVELKKKKNVPSQEVSVKEEPPMELKKKNFSAGFQEVLMDEDSVREDKEELLVEEEPDKTDELHEEVFIDELQFPEKPSIEVIEETFARDSAEIHKNMILNREYDTVASDAKEREEEFSDDPSPDIYDESSSVPDVIKEEENFDNEYIPRFISDEEKELELPDLSILLDKEPPPSNDIPEEKSGIADLLEETLSSFGVKARVIHQEIGPSITRYELQPAKGVRVNKITSLSDDIALALAALSVRLEAPIPGKSAIGIEIPNKNPKGVYLGEILSSVAFQKNPSKLTMGLGKDITGNAIVGDLGKMPHLLIAGATGAGKSVCLNSIVASILFKARPNEVHFAMIDPKRVELSVYKTIPHLVSINREHRVVVNPAEASELLDSVVKEMEDRYRLLAENRVRNIAEFNALNPAKLRFPSDMEEEHSNLVGIGSKFPMPYIVVIIDELADLMMVAPGEVEKSICRLAQLARAVGIHLVVATQRPSVNVITGIIKANIPSRISFAVSSQIDSRTILDMAGAEKLIGKGDMLYLPAGALKPQRVQGAYISLEAIEELVAFWETQSPPENLTDFKVDLEKKKDNTPEFEAEDELLEEAIDIVLASRSASVSQLQRALRVGHARAGRLIDIMEKIGVVGPWEGSKTRKILVPDNPLKRRREFAMEDTVGE